MDVAKIDSDFNENTEPQDRKLMNLLTQAYKGEILCKTAVADLSAIKPFSDYKPTVNEEFRNYFVEKAKAGTPLALFVYADDGKLVMSDDYNSYVLYKETKMPQAVCVVIGDTPEIKGVEYHGKPFQLSLPNGVTEQPDEA